MVKYRFTSETKVIDGVTLHRIEAVTDFYALKPYNEDASSDEFEFELIKAGTLGGWLETEANLSHEAFAWVADEACVYGEAEVSEGALIYGEAKVYEKAEVKNCARVFGKARIHGYASLYGHSMAYENADIESGSLFDDAKVYGNAHLYGDGHILVSDNAKVYDDAVIYSGESLDYALISEEAKICEEAEIYGDENETKIGDSACVSGKAKIRAGSGIYDQAEIFDSAVIDGATVKGDAKVCGDTVVPAGTLIQGNALVKLRKVENGSEGVHLPAGLYLTGDTEITSSADYMVIGPVETDNPVKKGLIFTLGKQREPLMTIFRTATSIRPLWHDDGTYPIDDGEYLKRLVLKRYKDSPELAGAILKGAECARGYFAKRIEELSQ